MVHPFTAQKTTILTAMEMISNNRRIIRIKIEKPNSRHPENGHILLESLSTRDNMIYAKFRIYGSISQIVDVNKCKDISSHNPVYINVKKIYTKYFIKSPAGVEIMNKRLRNKIVIIPIGQFLSGKRYHYCILNL